MHSERSHPSADPAAPKGAAGSTGRAPAGPRGPMVAGIGASAGGVQALQAFFEALPEDLGVAFVVVVHLSPEHRSALPAILAGRTSMPVTQVSETTKLEGDHVYVIAPDRQLEITDSSISTVAFDEPRGQRAPIDLFFRSLAAQHGDGFAVILVGERKRRRTRRQSGKRSRRCRTRSGSERGHLRRDAVCGHRHANSRSGAPRARARGPSGRSVADEAPHPRCPAAQGGDAARRRWRGGLRSDHLRTCAPEPDMISRITSVGRYCAG